LRRFDIGPSRTGFYILQPPDGHIIWGPYADALPFAETRRNPGGRGVCRACRTALGGRRWEPPHRIELSKAQYGDFVWGAGIDLLMSERALAVYRDAGLSGITEIGPAIEVVRVGNRKPEALHAQPPEYHEVIYRLDGADLDDERSDARRDSVPVRCQACRQNLDSVKGIFLKRGSWRRADIFGAFGLPARTLITEQFRDAILRAGLVGMEIVPSERYWYYREPWKSGFHLCDGADPGDSEVWFPPERNLPVLRGP
jgi:hypothetical protein